MFFSWNREIHAPSCISIDPMCFCVRGAGYGMNFFLYSAQASFSWPRVDLARLLRRAYSRSVWITFFEFVKVCGIRFSIWESFIGFYICCYPISTILACLFSVGVRISWKKVVLNESMSAKMAPCVSYLVYYYCR